MGDGARSGEDGGDSLLEHSVLNVGWLPTCVSIWMRAFASPGPLRGKIRSRSSQQLASGLEGSIRYDTKSPSHPCVWLVARRCRAGRGLDKCRLNALRFGRGDRSYDGGSLNLNV
jgi:hypothetical protein